jgi:hypothetical protein
MLDQPDYARRWKAKLAFYADNKIEREKTPGGWLIVTEDGPQQGLDSPAIRKVIEQLWGR